MRETRVRTADQLRRTDAAAALQGGIWDTESSQNTFTDGQGNKFWLIDTTAGNVSVALPAAADASPDTIFTVKRTTGGANTLTVTPDSGNIDGSAAHSIANQYAAFAYASDGTNWHIVRQHSPGEFITSASLATALAPYLTSASAALSTYLTSNSASAALATKQGNILFKDEGVSLSTAGSATIVDFVGGSVSATISAGVVTVTVGGGKVLLATLDGSTGGTTKSVTGIPSTYRELYIEVAGISFTAGATMTLAVSDDNGTAYGTARNITVALGAAGSVVYGTIRISNIQTTDSYAVAHSVTATGPTATATVLAVVLDEAGGTTAVINAIQFAGGTFDAGTIRVYGVP